MHFDFVRPRYVERESIKLKIGAGCRYQIRCLRKSEVIKEIESLKQNVRLTKEQCCMQCIGQPWTCES